MKMRQSNALRGLLYEFGAVFAKGQRALFSELEPTLESLSGQLPQMVADSLREQLDASRRWAKTSRTSTSAWRCTSGRPANAAHCPDSWRGRALGHGRHCHDGQASAFKSGREFCAWLGLVPNQHGTGGKVRLGNISKRGDTYLRTLLIHGARSVLTHAKQPGPWLEALSVVAQAAKMASGRWAKQQDYPRHQADQSLLINERAKPAFERLARQQPYGDVNNGQPGQAKPVCRHKESAIR